MMADSDEEISENETELDTGNHELTKEVTDKIKEIVQGLIKESYTDFNKTNGSYDDDAIQWFTIFDDERRKRLGDDVFQCFLEFLNCSNVKTDPDLDTSNVSDPPSDSNIIVRCILQKKIFLDDKKWHGVGHDCSESGCVCDGCRKRLPSNRKSDCGKCGIEKTNNKLPAKTYGLATNSSDTIKECLNAIWNFVISSELVLVNDEKKVHTSPHTSAHVITPYMPTVNPCIYPEVSAFSHVCKNIFVEAGLRLKEHTVTLHTVTRILDNRVALEADKITGYISFRFIRPCVLSHYKWQEYLKRAADNIPVIPDSARARIINFPAIYELTTKKPIDWDKVLKEIYRQRRRFIDAFDQLNTVNYTYNEYLDLDKIPHIWDDIANDPRITEHNYSTMYNGIARGDISKSGLLFKVCLMHRMYPRSEIALMDTDVRVRCRCDPTVFMFMARLQLAITAYNYIIRDGGFVSHVLGLIPCMDPILSRYTTRDAIFVSLMTSVDSSIADSTKDTNYLIALNQSLGTAKKRKITYSARKTNIVNHIGITVIHPLTQNLFSAQANIFAGISLFNTSFAPFLQFVVRVATLAPPVQRFVTQILAIDPSPLKSSRGKLDYSSNNTCNQIYAAFSNYIRTKIEKSAPAQVILDPEFQNLADYIKIGQVTERVKIIKVEESSL